MCRIVVLPIQPFAFLMFLLSSLSWHLKVPTVVVTETSYQQLEILR